MSHWADREMSGWLERTTEGMKGGVIFLAMRSSQLMGEKKEWYLSSSCREEVRDDQVVETGVMDMSLSRLFLG